MKVFFVNGPAVDVKRLAGIWAEDGVEVLFPWYEGKFDQEKEGFYRANALQHADVVLCFYNKHEAIPLFELGLACAAYVPILFIASTKEEISLAHEHLGTIGGAIRGALVTAHGFDIKKFSVRQAKSALPQLKDLLRGAEGKLQSRLARYERGSQGVTSSLMAKLVGDNEAIPSLMLARSMMWWLIERAEDTIVNFFKSGNREGGRIMLDEIDPKLHAGARAIDRMIELTYPNAFKYSELLVTRHRMSFSEPDEDNAPASDASLRDTPSEE